MSITQGVGVVILAIVVLWVINLIIRHFTHTYRDPGARSGWEAFLLLIGRR